MNTPSDDITALGASELSAAIHAKRLSCVEVMHAYLRRIAAVNPTYNAIVSLRNPDELLLEAREHDALLAAGKSKGWLHGIPQAIKDLSETKDLLTTFGSPLMKNNIPKEDGLMVQRMKAAGAIVIGKTNVPEFGLGSHTFNEVFGATKNSFNVTKSAGGSSGGAAVALSKHLLPVADGSDFMGSLRNPAAWNNIFGMRPSQGRIPKIPASEIWLSALGTEGAMGRSVEDIARLMQTQAGYDAREPASIKESFDLARALTPLRDTEIKTTRILWWGDLNAYLPLETGITPLCEASLKAVSALGYSVDALTSQAQLGFDPSRVWEAWLVWRKALVGTRLAPHFALPKGREQVKPEAQFEYDGAQTLTGAQFMAASVVRSSFYQAMLKQLEHYDAIALPTAQVWPFDVTLRYPKKIVTSKGSIDMSTYHRWMETTIYATFAGLPCISVPVGFCAEGANKGLPMGMQLIGRPQGDADLLRLAQLFGVPPASSLGMNKDSP